MFVCLDLETTGLNPKEDHVIEVAIVRFDNNGILEEWSSLVKPPVPIPEFTKRLTGIDDEMVKDAPTLDELRDSIAEKLGDEPIMGHFIFFDVNFLNHHGFDLKNTQLDTCQFMQVLLHNEPSYSLEVLTKKLNITQSDAHRALDDVLANIELYRRMRSHVAALNPEKKAAIQPILEKSTWNWAKIMLSALEESEGKLLLNSTRSKRKSSEAHADLAKISSELETPFLLEEPSFTCQDLIDYALSLNEQALITVPDLKLVPEHESLGLFKRPHDYIDEERLQRFLAKGELDELETSFGLKLLLWLFETETGERDELRIIKEEKSAWYDVCCEEFGEGTSYYKKAKEAAYEKPVLLVDHHHFLSDRSKKDPLVDMPKHVIVGQPENFVKAIENAWYIFLSEGKFIDQLRRLKASHPDHSEIIDHLAAKVSILFGLVGMVVSRHGEPNDPRHTLLVDAYHRNTPEWNKVAQSIDSIYATVAALGDDIQPGPTLDELDRQLHYLQRLFSATGPILWITLGRDQQPVIHSFPEQTRLLFTERVWKGIEKLHCFAHTANLGDDFKFLKSELGLPENMQFQESESSSPLPLREPQTEISNPNDNSNIHQVTSELSRIIPELQGNLFLLVTSKHAGEQFFYKLKKSMEGNHRKLFVQNLGGGMGKLLQMSKETDGQNLYVGDEGFMNFLLDADVELKFLGIHRLPFSYPNSPIQKGRASQYDNTYQGFSKPQASLNFARILSKFLGNEWKEKEIMVLDPRPLL